MARHILLKRSVAEANLANYGAYRLRVEVEAVVGDWPDDCIFIYRRSPANAYTGQLCDYFEAMAGPAQFSDYPAGSPDPDHGWPFYRLNYVELDFISSAMAEYVWQEISRDALTLATALDRLDNLVPVNETWYPYEPDITESSSSSE
jgi:hypothetical protein